MLNPTDPTAARAAETRAFAKGGVLLVGPLPAEPLVGGVEVGVSMLLKSTVAAQQRMQLFNTARTRDPSRSLRERLVFQFGAFARFTRLLLRLWPRIVHVKASWGGVNFSQSIGYCLVARVFGRRVLVQLHGGAFDTWYECMPASARLLVRFGLRRASEIVVLSEYWRELIQRLAPGAIVHVVPNGVELDRARPPASTATLPLKAVSIGTVGQRKGHFTIVEAAAQLRDVPVQFLFAGPQEDAQTGARLRARIDELGVGDSIVFLGPVGRDQKWQLLAQTDIFLLPSYGENLPNSALEAMAASLPIVCTTVGALPEMLEPDSNAIFMQPGDVAALAQAVRNLAADADRRAAMGRRNRAAVEANYSFERTAALFGELYDRRGRFGEPGARGRP